MTAILPPGGVVRGREDTGGDITDPTRPVSGYYRNLRGGCWDCWPTYNRVAYRLQYDPGERIYDWGFHLAKTSP